MEGIYFYWFCWLLWVIVTFLLPKEKGRTFLAIWILLTIIFSNLYISINLFEISLSYLFILFGGFIFLGTLQHKILQIFSAITIMVGFTSLLIWETNAPVWLFMPRLIIIPIICVLLTMMVNKHFLNRLAINIIGLCSGEFVYSVLLSNYSIIQTIGDFEFLDTLFVCLIILITIELIRKAKNKVLFSFTISKI
ncbi:YphA family membrane protein [Paucisalibacillus globulus]|uniref:YphA family membrane protein n=1 Tax=Paucisalibacillus globulus TaxID=351095 RepID=UPI0004164EA6